VGGFLELDGRGVEVGRLGCRAAGWSGGGGVEGHGRGRSEQVRGRVQSAMRCRERARSARPVRSEAPPPPPHTPPTPPPTCTPMKNLTVPSLSFMGASVNMFQKGLPLRL